MISFREVKSSSELPELFVFAAGTVKSIQRLRRHTGSLLKILQLPEMSNPKVVYEGWMVRYGRRKIGRSFIHMRYFVLESRLLAYYKKKPQDNVVNLFSNKYLPLLSNIHGDMVFLFLHQQERMLIVHLR